MLQVSKNLVGISDDVLNKIIFHLHLITPVGYVEDSQEHWTYLYQDNERLQEILSDYDSEVDHTVPLINQSLMANAFWEYLKFYEGNRQQTQLDVMANEALIVKAR